MSYASRRSGVRNGGVRTEHSTQSQLRISHTNTDTIGAEDPSVETSWPMSADEHLNETQFMGMQEFKKLYSGDYDEPMTKTMGNMQNNYKAFRASKPGDDSSQYPIHPQDLQHGGPRGYIDALKKDISANGIKEPLTVRGGNVLTD